MTTDRVARIEGADSAVMAGAASFMHIHDVTVQYGQPSWIGWANAMTSRRMHVGLS